MSIEAPPSTAIGNPVQRGSLLRSLRSNVIAAILTGWAALIAFVGVVVLGNEIGFAGAFETTGVEPMSVGIPLAQWWVVAVVAGVCVLMCVLACATTAAHGEQRRLAAWNATLVRPGRMVLGLWKSQLALGALALLLALPVAGIAVGFDSTMLELLGVGLAGAALAGAAASAFALAVSCRSRGVLRPLVGCLIVVVALFAGPFIAHQARGAPDADPVLGVVPVVAVADVAVPQSTSSFCVVDSSPGGPDCTVPPLARMYDSVEPASGPIPPWGFSAIGAVVIIVISLIVARFRIARPPRH